jgi:enamine deaminase RidA (YjgF/YER057c/UK114 family)
VTGKIDARLKELGVTLPAPPAPVSNFVPFVRVGSIVAISGQIPLENGRVCYAGLVSKDLSLEEAYKAARLCGLNLLAQAKAAAADDLDRVRRVVQLQGFVAGPPGFKEHAKVLNGASDLMVEVFGEIGRHTRVAVGAATLPLDIPVEIAGWFEIA